MIPGAEEIADLGRIRQENSSGEVAAGSFPFLRQCLFRGRAGHIDPSLINLRLTFVP